MRANRSKKVDAALLRIGDAARLVGVSPSTLRYWEREGLIEAHRNGGRTRYYTRTQIDTLRRIQRLRDEGLNGQAIRRELKRRHRSGVVRDDPPDPHPGVHIATARRAQGMTLRELAQRSRLSTSYLSSLERGVANASLSALHAVARALGCTTQELFASARAGGRVVRAGEGTTVRSADLSMEHLSNESHMLQPHLVRIPPGGHSGDAYAHGGEEFLHVLTGRVEVSIDEAERYTLEAGDSITFPSDLDHRIHNPGEVEATAVWVNTPKTF